MTILVTGGAGFIGANFVLDWLAACDEPVINLDKLSYAGNPENLASLQGDARHILVPGDIGDSALVSRLLAQYQPRAVINFAAESHVDRSIHGPEDFIETNIVGTFRLLQSVRAYWLQLPNDDQPHDDGPIVTASEAQQSMDRFVPRDDGSHGGAPNVTASEARQSMDRFVPRDDALIVTASEARQSMDRFVPRDDGSHGSGPHAGAPNVTASAARQSRVSQQSFRLLHVSTDEVYGSLAPGEPAFTEAHRYEPNSPYSASKAASDHLVRAWHHTYGLPVLTTNCSNNYGPYHFPEKLIPLMIVNALAGKPLPVYGDGMQIRDWLYVKDHCSAIRRVLEAGRLGEVYNVGGWNEKPNIEIVQTICKLLDELRPRADGRPYASQITYVTDRPGHDRRYAIDASKIHHELGWKPAQTFETGIRETVAWYLANPDWVAHVQSGAYRDWVAKQYEAVPA
jgi:dTDP-glucose 4,6-dehydratase